MADSSISITQHHINFMLQQHSFLNHVEKIFGLVNKYQNILNIDFQSCWNLTLVYAGVINNANIDKLVIVFLV